MFKIFQIMLCPKTKSRVLVKIHNNRCSGKIHFWRSRFGTWTQTLPNLSILLCCVFRPAFGVAGTQKLVKILFGDVFNIFCNTLLCCISSRYNRVFLSSLVLFLVKFYDNKMVELPGSFFYRSSFMKQTNKKIQTFLTLIINTLKNQLGRGLNIDYIHELVCLNCIQCEINKQKDFSFTLLAKGLFLSRKS